MFNFRLYDALVEALEEALQDEANNLAAARAADFGELKYRIGRYAGIEAALAIAEATRKKLLKE